MNIDLSKNELELLESALFQLILSKHKECFRATGEVKSELSDYLNSLEDLNHKIWKAREGITYEHSTKKPTKALETQKEKAAAEVA